MRRRCFIVRDRIDLPAGQDASAAYEGRPAEALAQLFPLLGCGEEAAAIGFDELARQDESGEAATLQTIAAEERVHDALIDRLSAQLPAVQTPAAMLAEARRFHAGLAAGGPILHLARIAALDAAVCSILGALLRAGGPITGERNVASVLARIRSDEVKHVRIARRMVANHGPTPLLRDVAAATRETLADIIASLGEALEVLEVDPARLDRVLRRLPDGLLAK